MRIYLLEFKGDGSNRWIPHGAFSFDSESAYKKLAKYKKRLPQYKWRVQTYRSEEVG